MRVDNKTAIMELKDSLSDDMSDIDAKEFLQKFDKFDLNKIDLFKIIPQFLIWLLSDKQYGVYQLANDKTKPIINEIVELYTRQLNGEIIDQDNWIKLRNKARVAAIATYAISNAISDSDIYSTRAVVIHTAIIYAAVDAVSTVCAASLANTDIAARATACAYSTVYASTVVCDFNNTYYTDRVKIQAEKLLQLLSEAPQCKPRIKRVNLMEDDYGK